jgi:hypothetical protein
MTMASAGRGNTGCEYSPDGGIQWPSEMAREAGPFFILSLIFLCLA